VHDAGGSIMADEDFQKAEKTLPYKTNTSRSFIQDRDSQIQMAGLNARGLNSHNPETPISFKNLYTHYMQESEGASNEPDSSAMPESQDLKKVMAEAEATFESMMQIREELDQAFKELMHIKS